MKIAQGWPRSPVAKGSISPSLTAVQGPAWSLEEHARKGVSAGGPHTAAPRAVLQSGSVTGTPCEPGRLGRPPGVFPQPPASPAACTWRIPAGWKDEEKGWWHDCSHWGRLLPSPFLPSGECTCPLEGPGIRAHNSGLNTLVLPPKPA